MSEYLIRTLLNDIDIGPPKKFSIKCPKIFIDDNSEGISITFNTESITDVISKQRQRPKPRPYRVLTHVSSNLNLIGVIIGRSFNKVNTLSNTS